MEGSSWGELPLFVNETTRASYGWRLWGAVLPQPPKGKSALLPKGKMNYWHASTTPPEEGEVAPRRLIGEGDFPQDMQ